MSRMLTTCVVAALLSLGFAAECSNGSCQDETSLLQVEQTVKRASERDEEVPRQMQERISPHHPPSEEFSEGELPEVLRKAADEDLAAIKKAKAKREKKMGKVAAEAEEDIKTSADLDVADKHTVTTKKKAISNPTAENEAKAPARTTRESTANEMDAVKDTNTDKSGAAATMEQVEAITKQKADAMQKEHQYMMKAAEAQKIAREASDAAMAAMKNASKASEQASKWHEAAAAEHLFFDKAEAAEKAALNKAKAQRKIDLAKMELAAKAKADDKTSAEMNSATKTAKLSEKAAFATEGSKGEMLEEQETVSLASYEQPSNNADWAW